MFQKVRANAVACSSAYTNLQPYDAGVVCTSSVHFCENETGGGSILLKIIEQGQTEDRAGVPATVLQCVYLEERVKVVDQAKILSKKFWAEVRWASNLCVSPS